MTGRTTASVAAESVPDDDELLALADGELLARARALRDRHHGRRVTFSPKVFIPLTMLCRDRCGYCTFAKPPARLASPYLSAEEVLAIARAGAAVGCHEALFTLGERPELRYPAAAEWLEDHGYATTLEYLGAMAALVRDETGLLPHANAGALSEAELAALRPVSASQGMMLESILPGLDCHRSSPDKTPARRLATLEAAGRLQIPFTTGILVGIGDGRRDRLTALRAIADAHRRHGHVQEVIVQNFLPKAGTAMHAAAPCDPVELAWSIAAARLVLPADVHVQSPPNLVDDVGMLLAAGIDDSGGSPPSRSTTSTPSGPGRRSTLLEATVEAAGHVLAPRLTLHPSSPSTRCAGSTRRCASQCSSAPTPRASGATTTGTPGATTRRRRSSTRRSTARAPSPGRAAARTPRRAGPSPTCSTASPRARSPARTSSSPCSAHAARSSTP